MTDDDLIRAHHAPLFRKWKKEWGLGHGESPAWAPGFVESLDEMFRQGMNLTDVSLSLGVSRERVRQWSVNYGLSVETGKARGRVWSDELSRFVPQSNKDARRARGERQAAERAAFRKEKRRRVKECIRWFVARHGRAPSMTELARAFIEHGWGTDATERHPTQWMQMYLYGKNSHTSLGMLDALYRELGLKRPNGAVGELHWAWKGAA